jgi:hypothetical protein
LGGPIGAACVPAVASACLIDSVLANNGNPAGAGKSGYNFIGASENGGTSYYVSGEPITAGQTGTRSFCSFEDAVVRFDPAKVTIATVATCATRAPLNQ